MNIGLRLTATYRPNRTIGVRSKQVKNISKISNSLKNTLNHITPLSQSRYIHSICRRNLSNHANMYKPISVRATTSTHHIKGW